MQGVKLGALGVFVATLLLAVNYHIAALDSIRTEKLRLENQRLSYAMAGVQNQLHKSAETLNHLSDDDRKLRIWAEIQDVDSDTRQLGVGGGESASPDWAGKVSDRSAGALRQAYVDLDRLNRQPSPAALSYGIIPLRFFRFPRTSTTGFRHATDTGTTLTRDAGSSTTGSTSRAIEAPPSMPLRMALFRKSSGIV